MTIDRAGRTVARKGVALGALLVVVWSAGAARAAIDVTGTWEVCLTCLSPCPLGGGAETWTLTQTGTALHVVIPGSFELDGTIDPMTGTFAAAFGGLGSGCGFFCLTGTATATSLTATLETLVLFGIDGRRACNPSSPLDCDDGDAGTSDACCNTPVGTCGPAVSCTHDDPPVCVPPSTTTTSTSTTSTTLVDRPVDAVRLLLRRTASGRERLVFTTRDPDVAFLPVGTTDDPATGTPGGARVELFSQSEGQATLLVPAGAGVPGWHAVGGGTARYRFVNPAAPAGPSVVRALRLRDGKGLALSARAIGLPLAGPQGAVGIRITTGRYRTCAVFDGSTVVVDQPGTFRGKGASAAALANCDDPAFP